ncbi:type II toxin-antitoxin system RelE/ParE family toxin [candidate division KSB1 bacterium]|nr:type II toxin-antitoxin system RelE/ParE family toxin [candidate division KSB1 bacterium]MBL7092913.1 type II toxin-antitoxin system RelE/ParE family toxin [candidate division KSB1 bacterium]
MKYKVKFIPSARKDFDKLDGRRKILVAKQLVKLENNPFAGKELGNKAGIDLTGYYKLYADKKKIRIVYAVIEERVIVKIIAIGERDELAVYREAAKRIKKK